MSSISIIALISLPEIKAFVSSAYKISNKMLETFITFPFLHLFIIVYEWFSVVEGN